MHVDVGALKQKISERGLTQEKIAKLISVDKSTFSRKMNRNCDSFSIGEMHKIVDVLQLSNEDAKNIFLANNSQ